MRMFDSYEHQQPSPAMSSCDMESMDEIAPPTASSILSLNEDLTMSSRLSTTTPQNSVALRFKKKRKRKLEPDTVSLRSLEDLVGDHFQRRKRLSLPRLSSVSELLSPMCDRVINMLQTTKQSSSANLLNLINHNTNHNSNIRRKPTSQQTSASVSSPTTVKKFRAAWSETCDGEKLKQTMTATEIERQNVLYELFSEEQQMIENLGLAQRVYRNGMKTLNILTDSELKQIFGPLEDILPLHEDLLYRLKPKGNSSIDAVGQIYLEWFQRIRSSYVSYCSNLINAKELLDAKRCEENGRVDDYLKRCTDSGFSRKLDLWDFLDQPRSRLMKYPILFKRIQKRTKDGHEDKRILLETINIVEELINDVSQATSAQLCSNVITRLVYTNDEQKHSLIEKQTRIICQGELKNNRGQKLHVFLFDDVLVFTRMATRNGIKSYQLTNYPIPVTSLIVEDIDDGVKIPELSSGSFSRTLAGSKPARNVFRCSSSSSIDNNNSRNTSMLLQARDMYDKQQWLSAFRSITPMDKQ
ncbi:unnamed protein product [Rotaria socialis]|uniref:Rho guanine nucleotide exchange factor 3 n=2 Tax=Rotaria socialis TaxID=392032 RepID=A0A817UT09_9BILA|nr:unnamed protein product [Rotaria socialis]CAF3362584.1 unnamed protein product [Rotaria socialis]CAF4248516.1 unnamed protein product [Rotaria socialis]CAF4269049.1 unnamed protein product [Rotaria socialis]CAF4432926.1 unnamed protein product [Rotaria socialis]